MQTESGKCKDCGKRPKAHKKTGCDRCIAIYHRKQNMTEKKAMSTCRELVGDAYVFASIEDIQQPYRDMLENVDQDVYLFGSVGVGKTYAMAAVIKKLVWSGHIVKRINFDDFCCKVRASMNSKTKATEYDLINELVACDTLFIDDLGIRSKAETDFAYVTLYTILNKRQEKLLPTFITTNKSIEQLSESFDIRIASRLSMSTVIEMKGHDRRGK